MGATRGLVHPGRLLWLCHESGNHSNTIYNIWSCGGKKDELSNHSATVMGVY